MSHKTMEGVEEKIKEFKRELFPCRHHPAKCDGNCREEEVNWFRTTLTSLLQAQRQEKYEGVIRHIVDEMEDLRDPATQNEKIINGHELVCWLQKGNN